MGGHSFNDIVFSWGPMILLIVVWIFFMTRFRQGSTSSSGELSEISRQQLEEVKRLNRTLERIAAALERPSTTPN